MSTLAATESRPGRTRRRRITETTSDRIVLGGIYTFLTFVAVVILFPLLYIVAASFSSATAVIDGKVWVWPVNPTLVAYNLLFHYPGLWLSYLNSIIYTVGGTVLSVSLSVMMGYPLSRRDFHGRRIVIWFLIFAFLFSGGLIPTYLLVQALHMVNTRWSMIVPGALSVFSVILAKSFFQTSIPDELLEAAEMDGANDVQIMLRIVLPLSKPIVAVLALIFAVGMWNSYFAALIYLNSQNLFPLQLVLRQVLELNQLSPSDIASLSPTQIRQFQDLAIVTKYAVIVIASVPMLALYPLAQRYFVKGLRIGSLTG